MTAVYKSNPEKLKRLNMEYRVYYYKNIGETWRMKASAPIFHSSFKSKVKARALMRKIIIDYIESGEQGFTPICAIYENGLYKKCFIAHQRLTGKMFYMYSEFIKEDAFKTEKTFSDVLIAAIAKPLSN
jgi:hypothetical protein